MFLLLASCGAASSGDTATADTDALAVAYGAVRDARICSALDERTELLAYSGQVERTEDLLFKGWNAGLGDRLSAAKMLWEETDAVSDKICSFQMGEPPGTSSLELYSKANDALEAAISAEVN